MNSNNNFCILVECNNATRVTEGCESRSIPIWVLRIVLTPSHIRERVIFSFVQLRILYLYSKKNIYIAINQWALLKLYGVGVTTWMNGRENWRPLARVNGSGEILSLNQWILTRKRHLAVVRIRDDSMHFLIECALFRYPTGRSTLSEWRWLPAMFETFKEIITFYNAKSVE